MSKIEYKELIAFHPGYYIKEIAKSQVSNLVNDKIDKSNKFCNLIAKLCFKIKNKRTNRLVSP